MLLENLYYMSKRLASIRYLRATILYSACAILDIKFEKIESELCKVTHGKFDNPGLPHDTRILIYFLKSRI